MCRYHVHHLYLHRVVHDITNDDSGFTLTLDKHTLVARGVAYVATLISSVMSM